MYFGRSAGSAQPLVWAHAEYVKLLRSTFNCKVFDCIPVVEERYGVTRDKRSFTSRMEIFQTGRPICAMMQGSTLRIMDANRFQVVWTADNWATTNRLESRLIGRPGAFADIPSTPGQTGNIVFTLYWPEEDRWLGHNCEVEILAETPAQGTAAEKPKT
jgi:glucoamylase